MVLADKGDEVELIRLADGNRRRLTVAGVLAGDFRL
jgi:hypothetical protein